MFSPFFSSNALTIRRAISRAFRGHLDMLRIDRFCLNSSTTRGKTLRGDKLVFNPFRKIGMKEQGITRSGREQIGAEKGNLLDRE